MTDENDKWEEMKWRRGRRMWFFIPLMIGGAFLFAAIVMWLWNAFMPDIFSGLKPIDYWHALGLLVLAKILLGCGFRGKHRCCGHRGGWGYRGMYWKQKWMNMSEEEKAKFKEEWKKRCEQGGPC